MNKILNTKLFILILIILFKSSLPQTWEILDPLFPPTDTLFKGSTINFVTKDVGWVVTQSKASSVKLLETKNGGLSWQLKWNVGPFANSFSTNKVDTNNIWFFGDPGNIIFSKNMGETWDTLSISYNYNKDAGFSASHFFNDKEGIAFSQARWFTSDGGFTWTKSRDSVVNLIPSDVCFVNDSVGWMVSINSDVYDVGSMSKTTDRGRTWSFYDKRTYLLYGVAFTDSLKGYAVGRGRFDNNGYIYKTSDGGENWEIITYEHLGGFWCISFLDSLNGWIGGSGKILRTTDGGESWVTQFEGLESDIKQLIILKNDKIAYAFGSDWNWNTHTLLRADLSNLTSVKTETTILPGEYSLSQNYPNPFNPSTTISYQIPTNNFVTLKVYDVLGNEVAMLVNQWQQAGNYNYELGSATGRRNYELPSGVYFYQLTAGNFVDTKKFILLK